MELIKEGNYRARAVAGVWCKVGSKGTPGVGIKFEFEREPGVPTSLWHVMYLTTTSLKDGSTVMDKTFDTLVGRLGYDESKPLVTDADGNQSFDKTHLADKEVEIVIVHEPDQKDASKMYPRVRWVNELGGSRMAGLPIQEVLGNINIKAAAAAARARMGTPAPTKAASPLHTPMNHSVKDIPF